MKQHPLSAAFPAMSDADFEALVDDIKANGQKEAVIVLDGMVLDGWHRFMACRRAKVECVTSKHDGSDPLAFVLSRNLHRRHLTAGQRAAAIVAATNWRPRGQGGKSAAAADPPTAKQLAEMADVSPRTIEHAKAAERAGLGDAVRDGTLSAEAAARVAAGGPEKQPPKEDPLKAELAEMRAALAEAADEVQRLSAIKGEGEDPGDLIKNLQAELRAVKQRRDDLMRENGELKAQIRSLERQVKAAKK